MAEYFDHGDTHETYLSLEELQVSTRAHLVLVTAVELAMDHKPSHREMTSVLLADLYGHLLFEPHYAKGTILTYSLCQSMCCRDRDMLRVVKWKKVYGN